MKTRNIVVGAGLLVSAACGADPTPSGAGSTGAEDSSTAAGESQADADSTATTGEPPPLPEGFEPFACDAASPDVTTDRLCDEAADPDNAPDEIAIQCRLEGSCIVEPPPPTDALVVMTYNIERGVNMDAQLALFGDALPIPDVLLLVEADRGCARSGERNVAWEYAEALGMNHVYGVEFIELPRPGDSIPTICEHGNAVLSRYPIGNVVLHRHETNLSWFDVADEPRLGGRMALLADIAVGDTIVHVQSLHFESGLNDGEIRAAQAIELAELGNAQPHPVVIGGDTNAGLYVFDLLNGTHNDTTAEAFLQRGYVDTHAALDVDDRPTRPPLILDLLFSPIEAQDPALCPASICGGLSDHLPVWATIPI